MWNIKIGIVGKAVPKQNTLSSLAIIATWAKTEKFFHKKEGAWVGGGGGGDPLTRSACNSQRAVF